MWATKSQLVFVWHLIGLEYGANFFRTITLKVKQNQSDPGLLSLNTQLLYYVTRSCDLLNEDVAESFSSS